MSTRKIDITTGANLAHVEFVLAVYGPITIDNITDNADFASSLHEAYHHLCADNVLVIHTDNLYPGDHEDWEKSVRSRVVSALQEEEQ